MAIWISQPIIYNNTQTNTGWIPITPTSPPPPIEEKKEKSEGCTCKKCREFFEYAEPNQDDGTMICWACRHGY